MKRFQSWLVESVPFVIERMQAWMAGSLLLLLVWLRYSYQQRKPISFELFLQGRCLGAIVASGENIHWNRWTLPAAILPAGWRLCFRFYGTHTDAWLHRHFSIPE